MSTVSRQSVMGAQWVWIVRLLGLFLLVPLRVSKADVIVRLGRPALSTAAFLRVILCTLNIFLTWTLVKDVSSDCFFEVIHRTLKVYNVSVVLTSIGLISFSSNLCCFVKTYLRDLMTLVGRSVDLYLRADKNLNVHPLGLSVPMKIFFILFYFSPFVMTNLISVICIRDETLWPVMLSNTLSCFLNLSSAGTATVFFVLLKTAEESLSLLNKQLILLVNSKTPRAFLEVTSVPTLDTTPMSRILSSRTLHELRMIHYDLVEFMEDVMTLFQAEILIIFSACFWQNILYSYSVVFNHKEMFQDTVTLLFVCQSLYLSVSLVSGLWMICAGPSRIKDKLTDLSNSTAKLSMILNLPSDIMYEIRISQLQIRNYKPSFEVFGMFELTFSLLFMLCASIVSYTVVLIQFSVVPEDLQNTTLTTSYPGNTSQLFSDGREFSTYTSVN